MLRNVTSINGLLQIGEMAERTGLPADAIRSYEREKFLRAASRLGPIVLSFQGQRGSLTRAIRALGSMARSETLDERFGEYALIGQVPLALGLEREDLPHYLLNLEVFESS
jgi:hypothetical protein